MPPTPVPPSPALRTFLAVRPPDAAVAHLRAAVPAPASAPERWHLTLVFCGDLAQPEALAPVLAPVCVAASPFALRLAGSGTFGRSGPVWVGVGGDVAALVALAGELAEACRSAGVEVERRPYRPHLTVGRRGRPDPALLADYAGPAWTASEVELVVSHRGRSVRHEVVRRFALAG